MKLNRADRDPRARFSFEAKLARTYTLDFLHRLLNKLRSFADAFSCVELSKLAYIISSVNFTCIAVPLASNKFSLRPMPVVVTWNCLWSRGRICEVSSVCPYRKTRGVFRYVPTRDDWCNLYSMWSKTNKIQCFKFCLPRPPIALHNKTKRHGCHAT